MPESKAELIVDTLRDTLAEIVGDNGATYWYTPTVVRHYDFDETCLDPSLDTIYVLVPDAEEKREGSTCEIEADQRVSIAACHRFEPATERPFDADEPIRWTIQNRMVRDIEQKLRGGAGPTTPFLGGLVEGLEVERVARGPETFSEKWAIAFLSVVASYSYRFNAP